MSQSRQRETSSVQAGRIVLFLLFSLGLPSCGWPQTESAADPLPAWNEGAPRQAILEFVRRVTQPGSADFVPIEDRIAVFDNDGTLWGEQPLYTQGLFDIDRIKTLAPQHPEWKNNIVLDSILKGDFTQLARGGTETIESTIMVTHTGMSTDEFERIVRGWIQTARYPILQRPFTECIYQPMKELLALLLKHDFRTDIVSGGGIDFMRPWTARTYGIPPEQVIGSSVRTRFEMQSDGPVILRLPEMNFFNDGPEKPVGIERSIGKRPIAAFGNSDGDLQMLQWTTAGSGLRLAMIVHHTDPVREFSDDRKSSIGKLDLALDEAARAGWTVVKMAEDWKSVFPQP